ncbi:DUF732 domain-containing protein [Tomitella gaofuii]|uniref:DUF732 domain-containing protein n=1 Tax=Tomitella gaofuii TaxID=2760083 RepID=UPI0015FB4BEB|nr:DUF732 domain-containing protein [Tomitella gaofuii]
MAAAVAVPSAMMILAACATGGGAESAAAPPPVATAPPAAATQQPPAQEADRTMAAPAADFTRALADRGVPAAQMGDAATLAQLARGICAQVAAGTPDAEIRERLVPVLRYAQSLMGDAMDEDTLAASFIDSARQAGC